METKSKLTSGVIDVLRAVNQNKNHHFFREAQYEKAVFVIFDKQQNPVIMKLEQDNYNQSAYDVAGYQINCNTYTIKTDYIVQGRIHLETNGRKTKTESWLDLLWVVDSRDYNQGLGSQLLKILEYTSYMKGAKKMKGYAVNFTQTLKSDHLKKYYQSRDFKYFLGNIKKPLKLTKMREYGETILHIFENETLVKFVLPKGAKEQVQEELQQYKNKLSKIEQPNIIKEQEINR